MTTTEKIKWYEEKLKAAQEVVAEIEKNFQAARTDAFREAYGFAAGDWVLWKGSPAIVTEANIRSGWVTVKTLTKAGKISQNHTYLYTGWHEHITLWPAGRPLPEVKP